jgi:hypothetical protein
LPLSFLAFALDFLPLFFALDFLPLVFALAFCPLVFASHEPPDEGEAHGWHPAGGAGTHTLRCLCAKCVSRSLEDLQDPWLKVGAFDLAFDLIFAFALILPLALPCL